MVQCLRKWPFIKKEFNAHFHESLNFFNLTLRKDLNTRNGNKTRVDRRISFSVVPRLLYSFLQILFLKIHNFPMTTSGNNFRNRNARVRSADILDFVKKNTMKWEEKRAGGWEKSEKKMRLSRRVTTKNANSTRKNEETLEWRRDRWTTLEFVERVNYSKHRKRREYQETIDSCCRNDRRRHDWTRKSSRYACVFVYVRPSPLNLHLQCTSAHEPQSHCRIR